jgi:hypothetical protein
LLQLTGNAEVNVQLRFLHLLSKEAFELVDEHLEPVACITAGGEPMPTWDEGVARSVQFGTAINGNLHQAFNFDFPGTDESETLRDKDGRVVGELRRSQDPVQGTITLTCSSISAQLVKLSIDVANTTGLPPYAMDRDSALLSSLLSAHTILAATGGEFVSLLEPADDLRQYVSTCQNVGNFPVLVGTEGERDMMLCSPIVLYDYPQVAPESAGDFYDATEMDEMLTLRVMTLTDQEKNEMRMAGERVRNLLERTEASAREHWRALMASSAICGRRAANDNALGGVGKYAFGERHRLWRRIAHWRSCTSVAAEERRHHGHGAQGQSRHP